MKSSVSVIILAAGESKRMGVPKQLMPLGRTSILLQTLNNYLDSIANEVIVVLGCRSSEIIASLEGTPVKVVVNKNYRQGISTSIISGLKLVNNSASGIMIALGDQPFIGKPIINNLIEIFKQVDKGIVLPVYKGEQGHPVIFSRIYKKELLALQGDSGGREIVARHLDHVKRVSIRSNSVIHDIDTLEEYYSILGKKQASV